MTDFAAAGSFVVDGDVVIITTPPAPTVPAHATPNALRRVSNDYAVPTIDGKGRVKQTRTRVAAGTWGYEQVIIGNTDVTWFRGVQTQVLGWAKTDPFGHKDLTLKFPQISGFERPHLGALLWLDKGQPVYVRLLQPDGSGGWTVRPQPIFEGFVKQVRPRVDGIEVPIRGFLYQGEQQIQKPRYYFPGHDVVDVGVRAPSAFNDLIGRKFAYIAQQTTGITTRKRGSLTQSRLDFADELLRDAWTTDGKRWTILPKTTGGMQAQLQLLAPSDGPVYTISYGQDGVDFSGLDEQWDELPNAVYGEFVTTAGGRSQNVKYPFYDGSGSIEGAFHMPFAVDTHVEPYLYDSNGKVTGNNPAYVKSTDRRETFVPFGDNLDRADVIRSAQQMVNLATSGYNLAGTITLDTDPVECHRFDIEPGRKLRVRHIYGQGTSGIVFHVSSVAVDRRSGQVSLMVDTKQRDALTVAQIIARKKAAKADPVADVLRRSSKISQNTKAVWDEDNKAGQVKPWSPAVGTWEARVFPAGTSGTIVSLEATASPACEWGLSLWNQPPPVAWLNASVGDPTSSSSFVDNPWAYFADELKARGWLQGWGSPQQPGGYSPGAKDNGTDSTGAARPSSPLSGRIDDDTSIEWASTQPPGLWVAVWVKAATTLTIVFREAPVEF